MWQTLSRLISTNYNDLANAPVCIDLVGGVFVSPFYISVSPEFYKVKSGGVTNGPDSSVTVSDLAFLWITLLPRNGGKRDTVSESRYSQAVKHLTHMLIGHEDFLSHVHGVDQLEAPKAVIPPSSGSDSSDESSSDSPSDSSDREGERPKTVPAPARVAAPK